MINGYIPAARFLPFLSWTDVAALPDKSNTVIVLPTGGDRTARPAFALLGGQRDIFRRGGPCPRQAAGDDPGLRHSADRLR
ncbi:Uncharacterised protein [Klebsiella aerogenes]|nr:Uncharacterised protein [Klebsiella aerogenes]